MLRNRLTAGRAIRRFTLGSGPLKRTSDRLEFLAHGLFAVVVLIAVAVAVGTAAQTQGRAELVAQADDRQQVSARLLEDAAAARAESGSVQAVARAPVVWTQPSGVERTDVIAAPSGARAGSTVTLWVTRDGRRTTRPLSDGDVAEWATSIALLTFSGISTVAFGAHASVRRLLDRSRSRRWAAEWAVVEPVWTAEAP